MTERPQKAHLCAGCYLPIAAAFYFPKPYAPDVETSEGSATAIVAGEKDQDGQGVCIRVVRVCAEEDVRIHARTFYRPLPFKVAQHASDGLVCGLVHRPARLRLPKDDYHFSAFLCRLPKIILHAGCPCSHVQEPDALCVLLGEFLQRVLLVADLQGEHPALF